jgi:hypothetical protein
VKFDDFKLPVSELGTMLAFAQKKAKETGQSVDYMVDSIVTGLGRKSLMILDNLGLSATEVKERMKDTGDMTKAVGEIIREHMAKSGDYVETAADRAAQSAATMQNKLEEMGRKFAPLEEASSSLWTSMKLGILDVVGGPLATLLSKLTEAGRLMNAYRQMGGEDKVGRMVGNLANAKDPKSLYAQQVEKFWRYINPREQQIKDIRAWQGGERSEALGRRISSIRSQYGSLDATKIQAEVDAAKKQLTEYQNAAKTVLQPVKVDIDTSNAEENIESLKVKLAELEAQRKKAIMAGDQDLAKNLTKQINQTKSLIKALDPNALKKTKEILPVGSVAAMNKELQELQKQQSKATNIAEWNAYEAKIKKVTQQIKELKGELGLEALRGMKGVSVSDGVQLPTRESILKKGDAAIRNFKAPEQAKQEVKLSDTMSQMSSGISSMVSGIEGLGIELPKGIKDVLGGIQSVASILAGISALVTIITTISGVKATPIIGWALANGGVAKAAGGYRVPGRTFSGDMIPARLNAGELVLNQAQAGVIANALQDRDFSGGSGMMQPYVDGEKIFLGMNNTSKRMGRGEIVTTSTLRRLGLM